MGNICPWCRKNPDDLSASGQPNERSRLLPHQSSISDMNDPAVIHSHNERPISTNRNSGVSSSYNNGEGILNSNGVMPPILPPEFPPDLDIPSSGASDTHDSNDPPINGMTDRMLPDLIDVGGWGAATHQSNNNNANINARNDHLKELISKSFQSTRISTLPDAGATNLSNLLSARPVAPSICHFITHTASELSRLLVDEIKIVHKEDLVVTFE